MHKHSLIGLAGLMLTLGTLPAEAQDVIGGIIEGQPLPVFLPPEERGSGFRPGEKLQFHGGWGIFSDIARITVTTKDDPGSGRNVFHIVSLASTHGLAKAFYPANTRTDTFLDADNWTLLSSHLEGRTNKEDNKSMTLIDYGQRVIRHVDDLNPEKSYSQPLKLTPILDYMSAVFQMRGLPLEVGRSFPIFVQGGGDFYLVQVEVTGIETIKSAFGRVSCFVLKPSMANPSGIFARGGGISLWMTNDAYRLPIRADVHLGFGTARLRLDSYETAAGTLGKKRR